MPESDIFCTMAGGAGVWTGTIRNSNNNIDKQNAVLARTHQVRAMQVNFLALSEQGHSWQHRPVAYTACMHFDVRIHIVMHK